jgi:hypothetical protein
MKTIAFGMICLGCWTPAAAQFAAYTYHIGQIAFHETPGQLTITLPSSRTLDVALLAGGGEWPPVVLAENGQLSVGTVLVDSVSGTVLSEARQAGGLTLTPGKHGFSLHRNGTHCTLSRAALGLSAAMSPLNYLKSRHVQIVASDTGVLALTRQDSDDPARGRHAYAIKKIDMAACKVSATRALGDPDYLVELGWTSKGGWWLTGSIEQTLLRSMDGLTWTAVPLHDNAMGLISSYVVNALEIWLAAFMPDAAQPNLDAFELLYSHDAGKTWRGVRPGDALMRSIPPYWLEGARRSTADPK